MKNYCVVGGGISGILSALILSRERNNNVYLIEKEGELGGLLRSITDEKGYEFDFGTHLLAKTNHLPVDELVFSEIKSSEWNELPVLKNGNYFRGHLNQASPFVDSRLLDKKIYEKGTAELLKTSDTQDTYANLKEQLENFVGPTFTDNLYRPILQKFYGTGLEDLAPNCHLLIGPARLIAFTPEETRTYKRQPRLDKKIAFHSFLENPNPTISYYPKNSGINLWVHGLIKKLQSQGVNILCGRNIVKLNHHEKVISSLELDDGKKIQCDNVIWTIAPFLLLRLADIYLSSLYKSEKVFTNICHFTSNKKPTTDLHYLTCFDSDLSTFRVTLYDNFQEKKSFHKWRVTVEAITTEINDIIILADKLKEELITMKIFSFDTVLELVDVQTQANGFPRPTKKFQEQSTAQLEIISSSFHNLILTGKSSGESFFMTNVLLDTFKKVSQLSQKS
jgi:protoporphyrinogen oxidase